MDKGRVTAPAPSAPPREPTWPMIAAADRVVCDLSDKRRAGKTYYRAIWRAMYDAAPARPEEQQPEVPPADDLLRWCDGNADGIETLGLPDTARRIRECAARIRELEARERQTLALLRTAHAHVEDRALWEAIRDRLAAIAEEGRKP